MNLIIVNNGANLNNFCPFVIKKLQIISNKIELNKSLMQKWEDYLKSQLKNFNLTIKEIIKFFFNNQTFYNLNGEYIIHLKPNLQIKGFYLEKLASFIEQGNLDIKGYKIFETIYQQAADNILSYYSEWKLQEVQ